MSVAPEEFASVRYIVDDVPAAVDFYTTHLGFTLRHSAGAAFADVVRGPLRVLLSGPASSGARATPKDLRSEIDGLTAAGVTFRSDIVTGPGGQQILIHDPAGNLIELFQPASDRAR